MLYMIIEGKLGGGQRQTAPTFIEANSLADANDQYAEILKSIGVAVYDVTIYEISDYRQFCSPEENIALSDKISPYLIGLGADRIKELLKGGN